MKEVSSAIVTGGAGFIGSHIVDELLRRGIETTVIDNFTTGGMQNLSQHKRNDLLHVVRGDASDINILLASMRDVDVVFHEAAIASVPKSIHDPIFVHETNVNASLQVMMFSIKRSVRRMVFASSAAVYGPLYGRPASEDLLCAPTSPYGASKLSVENYLTAFRSSFGLETVALRYFNVYGPRQGLNEYSGVITVFANSLVNHVAPVIYGDGLQNRDFVHVRDVVQANMLAMSSAPADGQAFNVASGRTASIIKLFETLKDITESEDVVPKFEAQRLGDVRSGSASISKIRDTMGFNPSVTLEEGLESVVRSARQPSLELAP